MEHFIKKPSDYRLMARALEGSTYSLSDRAFDESEAAIGDRGITIAHVDRTPFQKIQIDFAGIEAFSYHLADQEHDLFDLLEMMNRLKIDEFACVAKSKAEFVKLWENIGIDAMGPRAYRKYVVPVYEGINGILQGVGKKLMVHYDGNIRLSRMTSPVSASTSTRSRHSPRVTWTRKKRGVCGRTASSGSIPRSLGSACRRMTSSPGSGRWPSTSVRGATVSN